MQITKDISIGEDKWIKWIEIEPNEKDLLEIDIYLIPSWEFWKKLETECVIQCCGIDSFSFWFDDIKSVSNNFNISNLIIDINELKKQIENKNKRILISEKLNNLFEIKVFIELLNHIIKTLEEINK